MGEGGEPRGGSPLARRDLEHVAVAVGVVRDHVEHERANHANVGRVVHVAVLLGESEALLHECFGQVSRPEAVGRKLLACQVHQPDVPLELPVA